MADNTPAVESMITRTSREWIDKQRRKYLKSSLLTLFWRVILLFVVFNAIFILRFWLRHTDAAKFEEHWEDKGVDNNDLDKDDSDLPTPHDAAKINSQARSPTHLTRLAVIEKTIVNDLNEYAKVLRRWLRIIDTYQFDYESSVKATRKLNSGPDLDNAVVENPILAYRMIRRYTKLLGTLKLELPKFTNSFIQKLVDVDIDGTNLWPSWNDLNDAMDAILRLHHVYDLDLNELTSGNLRGTETIAELNAEQCKEIGEFAVNVSFYSEGVDWLETALNKTMHLDAAQTDINTKDLQESIQKSLDKAVEKHDLEMTRKGFWSYHLFQEKLRTANNTIMATHDRKSDRKMFYNNYAGLLEEWYYNDVNFWGLCSGVNMQTQLDISELFCWYETRSNPAWTIYPLKMEQLSKSPYLVQIYELLSDKIIDVMKKEASPNLARSHVVHSGKGGATYAADVRTSVESRLDSKTEISRKLSGLVELITGLIAGTDDAAESFLIASYAFGGHYACHLDALDEIHIGASGNRIATVMFYLSDVEIGGFTAFPHIGTAAKPVKGSAVFWYNLLKSGERDTRTYHGACPVLLGQKWIATKWIRAGAQLHTRPCSLNAAE